VAVLAAVSMALQLVQHLEFPMKDALEIYPMEPMLRQMVDLNPVEAWKAQH
jgi:hypothetical protein